MSKFSDITTLFEAPEGTVTEETVTNEKTRGLSKVLLSLIMPV